MIGMRVKPKKNSWPMQNTWLTYLLQIVLLVFSLCNLVVFALFMLRACIILVQNGYGLTGVVLLASYLVDRLLDWIIDKMP